MVAIHKLLRQLGGGVRVGGIKSLEICRGIEVKYQRGEGKISKNPEKSANLFYG